LQDKFNAAFNKYIGQVMDDKLFQLIADEAIDIMDDDDISTGFNIYTDFQIQSDGSIKKLFKKIEIDIY
jgi:hypothetical protein